MTPITYGSMTGYSNRPVVSTRRFAPHDAFPKYRPSHTRKPTTVSRRGEFSGLFDYGLNSKTAYGASVWLGQEKKNGKCTKCIKCINRCVGSLGATRASTRVVAELNLLVASSGGFNRTESAGQAVDDVRSSSTGAPSDCSRWVRFTAPARPLAEDAFRSFCCSCSQADLSNWLVSGAIAARLGPSSANSHGKCV